MPARHGICSLPALRVVPDVLLRSFDAAVDRNHLDLGTGIDPRKDVVESSVEHSGMTRDGGDADDGGIPEIVVGDFGNRDAELVSELLQQTLEDSALVFEAEAAIQTKLDLQRADEH